MHRFNYFFLCCSGKNCERLLNRTKRVPVFSMEELTLSSIPFRVNWRYEAILSSVRQSCLILTCLPSLCVTQTLLHYVDIVISCDKRAHSVCSLWLMLAQGSCAHMWHHLPWTPVGSHAWSLPLQTSWRDRKGRAGPCCKGSAHKETSVWIDCFIPQIYCYSTWGRWWV